MIMRNMLHGMKLVALLAFVGWSMPSNAAEPLGLNGENQAQVTGKVVDIICELAHECAPNCGNGKLQLGIKTADNKLYFASKSHVIFAGSTNDLAAYCGKTVMTDGLTTTAYGSTLLYIQRFKTSETGDWIDATGFRRDWAKAHGVSPDSKTAKEWYKNDKVVLDAIALHGKLGLDK